jgi:hypothetical protein
MAGLIQQSPSLLKSANGMVAKASDDPIYFEIEPPEA